jgi:hypothetical protein
MQPQLALAEEFVRIFRAYTVFYQMPGPVGGWLLSRSLVQFFPKIPKKGLTLILFGSIIRSGGGIPFVKCI